jgi:hypothetical protein
MSEDLLELPFRALEAHLQSTVQRVSRNFADYLIAIVILPEQFKCKLRYFGCREESGSVASISFLN